MKPINIHEPPHVVIRLLFKEAKFENEEKIDVIWHKKNIGLSGARNTGFSATASNIIIPLDADDELPHDSIKTIALAFKQHPDADFIFGNYTKIDESNNSELFNCSYFANNDFTINPSNLAKNWGLLGTSPIKKELWKKVGGYDLKFANAIQDVDFWMRAIMTNANGYYINENIYNWYIRSIGMSNNVQPIYHIHNFKKNLSFYTKFGDIPNRKKATNLIFLRYYGNEYFWQSFKFGLSNFFTLSRYSKKRVFMAPLLICCPTLINKLKQLLKNSINK